MAKTSKTAEIEAMAEKIAAMELLAQEKEETTKKREDELKKSTEARFQDLENAALARERKLEDIIAEARALSEKVAARDHRLDEMAHEAFNERVTRDQTELGLEHLQQDAEADMLAMERKLHISEAKERETRAELLRLRHVVKMDARMAEAEKQGVSPPSDVNGLGDKIEVNSRTRKIWYHEVSPKNDDRNFMVVRTYFLTDEAMGVYVANRAEEGQETSRLLNIMSRTPISAQDDGKTVVVLPALNPLSLEVTSAQTLGATIEPQQGVKKGMENQGDWEGRTRSECRKNLVNVLFGTALEDYEDPDEFFLIMENTVDSVCTVNGVKRAVTFTPADVALQLRGRAFQWFVTFKAQHPQATYKEFKVALIKEFSQTRAYWERTYTTCHQGVVESVSAYTTRIRSIAAKVAQLEPIDEPRLFTVWMEGLYDGDIKKMVKTKDVFADALALAKSLEDKPTTNSSINAVSTATPIVLQQKAERTCYNCGEGSHFIGNCPHPMSEKQLQRQTEMSQRGGNARGRGNTRGGGMTRGRHVTFANPADTQGGVARIPYYGPATSDSMNTGHTPTLQPYMNAYPQSFPYGMPAQPAPNPAQLQAWSQYMMASGFAPPNFGVMQQPPQNQPQRAVQTAATSSTPEQLNGKGGPAAK